MLNPDVLVLISALCILPAVITGAATDWRKRKFPAFLWNWPSKISGIFTFLLYVYSLAYQQYVYAAGLAFISLVFFITFIYLERGMGSGGDYRALRYASVLLPTLIIQIIIVALLVGILQVILARVRHTTAPWAIGICIAILIATGSVVYGITQAGILI
jgi:hypothetical protein